MPVKVLFVDDEDDQHRKWYRALGEDHIRMLCATTIERAEQLFSANPDLAAIVMDTCVPGDRPTTPPLVRKFRQSFTGPIIAASSSRVFREQLKAVGCDHACEKECVPEDLLRILKIK